MEKTEYSEHMSYEFLKGMKATYPAWKLLTATYAPLAISFFYMVFVADNKREIPEYILSKQLSQYIDSLDFLDDEPPPANELLTQWADDNHGWLRKFHPNDSDEIHYDITSTTQKAINWIISLKTESFIGTESRLIMIYKTLHEIIEQSEHNPEIRIRELERRKAELDDEIELAKKGIVKTLEPVQIKERFMQAMQMSHEILSDFRAVEQNFRELKRKMHAKIASWDKGKGALLTDFFSTHDEIYQSEQGKSFQAFFDFLMSKAEQDNFGDIIQQVCALDVVRAMTTERETKKIVRYWISGGIHVQDTVASISEQLRRYVAENFLEEERRINTVIKSIEGTAILMCNDSKPSGSFIEIDSQAPEISLPFDRPLFTPPAKNELDGAVELSYGDKTQGDATALYRHISVDKNLLRKRIENLLETQRAVSLAELITHVPLTMGLTELITYIAIAQERPGTVIEDGVNEPISWVDAYGKSHRADFDRIIYVRKEDNEHG